MTSALAEPEPSDRQRFVAEGVGTLLLLAVVIGSGIMAERLAGGNVAIALLANTAATVGGLYVLIEVFGPISGAHFNPAVSIVLLLGLDHVRGKLWATAGAQLDQWLSCQALAALLEERARQSRATNSASSKPARVANVMKPAAPATPVTPATNARLRGMETGTDMRSSRPRRE